MATTLYAKDFKKFINIDLHLIQRFSKFFHDLPVFQFIVNLF